MNPTVTAIISFSIGIAAIIGCVRFRKIDPAYYSFIYLVWLGLANEILSFFLIRIIHSNAVNSNIYVILEALLILWFFKDQLLFIKLKKLFVWLAVSYLVMWIIENFLVSSIDRFNSYFIIVYSFATVLMSINLINRLITGEKRMIFRNAAFVICVGFILFNTCKILIEIFWIYGLNSSKQFRIQIYRIMVFVNLIVNLIFALAVLWIPRKREFILP